MPAPPERTPPSAKPRPISFLLLKVNTITRVIWSFVIISAIIMAAAFVAVRNINRSAASSDWVNHTHAAILEVDGIASALQSADGEMRTFVMTGEARDQVACREDLEELDEHLEVAKALTRSEPAQSAQVLNLEALAAKRADFIRSVLAARSGAQPDAARGLIEGDRGLAAMPEIRRAAEKLKNDEMGLLADRDTVSYRQAQATRWTLWAGVALDVILLAGVAWLLRDDLIARRRAADALEEANRNLDARVKERTAELAAANSQLSADNMERRWANQALEHQVHYESLIINSISDMIFVLTKAMNISRINPAVTRLTGLEPHQLVNKPVSSIVRLTSQQRGPEAPLVDPIAQALREGRDLRNEPAVIEDRRGGKTAVRYTLFPLRDGNKVVGGIVVLQIAEPKAL